MGKVAKAFAWIFVILGSLGVYLPHIMSLAGSTLDLNMAAHPIFEIFSITFVIVGFLWLLAMCMMKRGN